jgi:hypothetical protein
MTLSPELLAMIHCERCKNLFDHRLVDAIMLDDEGNKCSTEVYCEPCFDAVKIVADDEWRPL